MINDVTLWSSQKQATYGLVVFWEALRCT